MSSNSKTRMNREGIGPRHWERAPAISVGAETRTVTNSSLLTRQTGQRTTSTGGETIQYLAARSYPEENRLAWQPH